MAKELTIPERLAWLLKERGVSQNALAKDAKVSPQTVANTLRHGRVPQSRTINKFARTLGVSSVVFDTKKTWTEADLKDLIAKSGPFTTKKPAAKIVAKKPAAKKAVAKKATAKKVVAKKPVAKKATVKKATTSAKTKKVTAKKVVAKKPAAKKAAIKKPVAKKAVAKKAVAKKTTTKRVVAKKAPAKRATAGRVVRHGSTSRTSPARKPAASTNGRLGSGVDMNAIVAKLEKLSKSRSEQVALEACKALLTLRG